MLIHVVFLIQFFLTVTDAVNAGCECHTFTSTFGRRYGIFTSPDYPSTYDDNINCILYTFTSGRDEIIELSFVDFDIQKTHLDCAKGDFLKVFLHLEKAEVNEYTPWSYLLCGGMADIPHILYSSGPSLILEFHSDKRPSESTGFFGEFRFINRRSFITDGQRIPGTKCDYQFINMDYSITEGKFFSPRYPSNYPKNVKCSYKFKAQPGERIGILFEEVTLQLGDISCLNRADLIKIYDGKDSLSPVINFLCNTLSKVAILSTGPELYIEFVANSEWPGQGFKANYYYRNPDILNDMYADLHGTGSISDPMPGHVPYPKDRSRVNYTLLLSDDSKNGTITSPEYPNPYPSQNFERYEFRGKGRERVHIVFTDFSLYQPNKGNKECDNIDSVSFYIHLQERVEKIDTFCGSYLPKPIMSNGPVLIMDFDSIYSSRNVRGFKFSYSFTEDFGIKTGQQLTEYPCAFVYNSNHSRNGTFTSPNFPGFYPRDTECHFFFHGNQKERVSLHFSYFDVEGVLPCEAISASDYVEFSNYMARDRKYSRYCGLLKPFFIESDRKFFRVTFRSNDRLDGTGFKAFYQFSGEVDNYRASPDLRTSSSSASLSELCFVLFLISIVKHV